METAVQSILIFMVLPLAIAIGIVEYRNRKAMKQAKGDK